MTGALEYALVQANEIAATLNRKRSCCYRVAFTISGNLLVTEFPTATYAIDLAGTAWVTPTNKQTAVLTTSRSLVPLVTAVWHSIQDECNYHF